LAGIWTLALIGLQFTKALPTAVGIWGLCLLALGVAPYTRPSPANAGRPAAHMQNA
jgi:hypothetical protein